MKISVVINVNEIVKVKLTQYGRQVERELYGEYSPLIKKADISGYTSWQLHDLMNTFGAAMLLGGQAPFELNDILIERETRI